MTPKKKGSIETTCLLNVDLDVVAPRDLSPFVQALGPSVLALYTGPGRAGYETHLELARQPSRDPSAADAAIRGFVKLLDALPPRARRLWNIATRRDFNIGIQGGLEPRAFEFGLQSETLKTVARLRARVVVTVYAVDSRYLQEQQRSRCGRGSGRRRTANGARTKANAKAGGRTTKRAAKGD